MPPEHEGGQATAVPAPPPSGGTLGPLLRRLDDTLARDLTPDEIAARAGTSTRTLDRRFHDQTGGTPPRWRHRARIRRVQHLPEGRTRSVDRIAAHTGFGPPTVFRDRFEHVVGVAPAAYRRPFARR